MSRLLRIMLVVACSACFNPTIGEIECGPLRECPPDRVCDPDNICRPPSTSSDAAPDSAPNSDAPEERFDVAHLPPGSEDAGDSSVAISDNVSIDTTLLTVEGGVSAALEAVAQEGGPELAVWRVASLSIAATATVRITGERALVVVSSGGIVVDGLVDASATGAAKGPGAQASGAGGAGQSAGEFFGGGGGGGFGSAGGRGGSTEGASGGAVGVFFGDATQTTLLAGSGGGSAAVAANCETTGGGGGGGLQLTSFSGIAVSASGIVSASGGGGSGGRPCGVVGGPGAGGGSGGALYFEAPTVRIDGLVVANGGGGGGGSGDDGDEPGQAGADGAAPTLGKGGNAGNDGGRGGDGGRAAALAENGRNNDTENGAGGGAGGGVGRITIEGAKQGDGAASPPLLVIELE